MCLSTIISDDTKETIQFCEKKLKKVKHKGKWWYVGWKYMMIDHDEYRAYGRWYKFNKEQKSVVVLVNSDHYPGTSYNTGFHIFTTRASAREYCPGAKVTKVLFRLPRLIGTQYTSNSYFRDTIIADRMLVPK